MRGSGANKRRPAAIVSNDRANSIAGQLGREMVTVVPVASNTDRIFPLQALLPAAVTGLRPRPADVMVQLDDALRLHLQL